MISQRFFASVTDSHVFQLHLDDMAPIHCNGLHRRFGEMSEEMKHIYHTITVVTFTLLYCATETDVNGHVALCNVDFLISQIK